MASAPVYYVYKWISLGSIEERASTTTTPIAEEETRGAEEERFRSQHKQGTQALFKARDPREF